MANPFHSIMGLFGSVPPAPMPAAVPAPPAGQLVPGNIDFRNRPVVQNLDGTSSTVRTITIQKSKDGPTILIPTVVNGKIVSDAAAEDHYDATGEHMGIFQTDQQAQDYDKNLHIQMGWNGAPGSAQDKWMYGK